MSETTLKDRIETVMKEAKELAEYWTGTLHEQIINQELDEFLKALSENETVTGLLQKLENTLAKAREEIERSDNEG